MGEILKPSLPLENTMCNYDLFSHRGGISNANECRLRDPVSFIERYIFQLYSSEILAVGFKVAGANWQIWGHLRRLDDLKVIRINRKNYLQMLASFMIAMKRNAWTSKCSQKDYQVRDKSIILEYNDCKEYFGYWDRWQLLTKKIFSGHAELEVFYENLIDYREKTTCSVLEFLGVYHQPLISDLEKQNQEPLSVLVKNYYELKTRFSNTKWSKYFIE